MPTSSDASDASGVPSVQAGGVGGTDEGRVRVGLLGGTFDPPHRGHLDAAAVCQRQLGLERVLLVVANDPWQKAERAITPAEDRFAMVVAAVDGVDGVDASRLEIDRGGPSYTVDTVEELCAQAAAARRPGPDIFLIVGSDLVPGLRTWKRVEDLQRLVTLAVVSRPGSPKPCDPPGWRVVHVLDDTADVSSSEVRELLRRGKPVGALVPEPVIRCIRRRGLYAVGR